MHIAQTYVGDSRMDGGGVKRNVEKGEGRKERRPLIDVDTLYIFSIEKFTTIHRDKPIDRWLQHIH